MLHSSVKLNLIGYIVTLLILLSCSAIASGMFVFDEFEFFRCCYFPFAPETEIIILIFIFHSIDRF